VGEAADNHRDFTDCTNIISRQHLVTNQQQPVCRSRMQAGGDRRNEDCNQRKREKLEKLGLQI